MKTRVYLYGFYDPWVLQNPQPVPVKTRTRGCGYRFPRVRVRVALENPRVARDIPYAPGCWKLVELLPCCRKTR